MTDAAPPAARYNNLAAVSLVLLIFLCLGWELWWAPLRPGGSWLVLKTLPLLLPLFGILRRRRYTHQWAALLIWIYFTEGVVRATTDVSTSRLLAGIEVGLSLTFFIGAACYARCTARGGIARRKDPAENR